MGCFNCHQEILQEYIFNVNLIAKFLGIIFLLILGVGLIIGLFYPYMPQPHYYAIGFIGVLHYQHWVTGRSEEFLIATSSAVKI